MGKPSPMPKRVNVVDLLSAKPYRTTMDRAVKGRGITDRRWRLWQQNPKCAACGRLLDYLPDAFEVDHVVPIESGGADHDANCQLLCVFYDADGAKRGCHMDKSNAERRRS